MKIFRFVKKVFFLGLNIWSYFTNALNAIPLSATPLNCISMKNQECKARPQVININSNDPIFYPFSIKINKCSGKCNNINNPYAKICVPDVIKDLNFKVFNLMSRTNETRFIKWHEKCKCKCRLDAIVFNNKAFSWLIVWADGINKCGWCLAGSRGRWLKGPHQIPSVSWISHHSLHFHIYQIVSFATGILCSLYCYCEWWGDAIGWGWLLHIRVWVGGQGVGIIS